jgi:uncharacterized iron-regulated protein
MNRNYLIIFLLILIAFINCSNKIFANDVIRLRDKKVVSFQEMIDDIFHADIIIVGEFHDVKEHHQFQLKVIKAIFEKEKNIAIAMEMFRADSQVMLDKWVKGNLSVPEFQKVYYDNWRMGWPLYADILFFARDNKVPIIGLNVPSEITRKVAQKGFASLTEEELKWLPQGLTCEITEAYMNFIRRVYGLHNGGREFVYFCEAQMVWDTAMAINTINYLEENKNIKKVVLITGSGHAWRHAIPEQIKKRSNYKVSVILPKGKDKLSITAEDTDYLF